jgi:hypothetical protein
MRTKNSIIRQKIFDSFSKNLDLISERFDIRFGINTDTGFQEIEDKKYVCPLCLKVFIEQDLEQKNSNPLTIEDIPPKATKKSILLLTCKKCNNESGFKLDYIIKQQLKSEPFFKGTLHSSIPANLNLVGNKYIKGQIKIVGENSLLFELPDKSNPFIKDSMKDLMQNWSKQGFTFNYRIPDDRKLKIAYLRIGYLLFFNTFGYLPLLDENLKTIRNQLQNPDENILSNFGIVYNLEKKDAKEGIHLIYKPNYIKSYLIVIDISTKSFIKKIGIIIPGPGEEGLTNYKNVFSFKGKEELTIKDVSSKEYITQIDQINAYYSLYNGIN